MVSCGLKRMSIWERIALKRCATAVYVSIISRNDNGNYYYNK